MESGMNDRDVVRSMWYVEARKNLSGYFKVFQHTTYHVRHTMLMLILFMVLPISTTTAQVPFGGPATGYPADLEKKLEKRISLDLRDISVIDVLKFISSKAELNIVATQNITARVTLFLKDVSIGSALDVIILSSGLAIEEQDSILYVMTEEEYVALFGESYRDQRHVKILQLKYTDAQKVGDILGG